MTNSNTTINKVAAIVTAADVNVCIKQKMKERFNVNDYNAEHKLLM